jgi:enoyl-[acyl-carrier protein] reductase I
MGFLHGKRALITGIISQRSIAWGIANAMHREGAQLAFTYVNDKLKNRVDEAANTFGSNIVLATSAATSRSTNCSTASASIGTVWTYSSIRSASLRARLSKASFLRV